MTKVSHSLAVCMDTCVIEQYVLICMHDSMLMKYMGLQWVSPS